MTEPVDSTSTADAGDLPAAVPGEPADALGELAGLDQIADDLAAVELALQRIEQGDFSTVLDPSVEPRPGVEGSPGSTAGTEVDAGAADEPTGDHPFPPGSGGAGDEPGDGAEPTP